MSVKVKGFDDLVNAPLAIDGGPKAVGDDFDWDAFHWPIVTEEDEQAVLEVLRAGTMSRTEITKQFEAEFAEWMGMTHALATCNGTAGILAAMWACGVGAGDEIICPSITYWASAAPALQLGSAVNFADIDPNTLCIDPKDIEHRIGERTKAIVVVHYFGHPCDMDAIMDIARSHNVKVIEDVSHAHGALYKGKKVGSFGDISVMSMMSGKSFPIGEGGMIVTNNRPLYERCVAFGHYERTGLPSNYASADKQITDDSLSRFAGLPLGAAKHRMNQTCSAMGRVQLRHYDERTADIQAALNRFWDLLEGTPGLIPHRPASADTTMGGWYAPHGLYDASQLNGMPCEEFCKRVQAEGVTIVPGTNRPLHLHPYFNEADIFSQGSPTVVAFGQRDVRQGPGSLPVAERVSQIAYSIPYLVRDIPELIAPIAAAYKKAARV